MIDDHKAPNLLWLRMAGLQDAWALADIVEMVPAA